MTQQSEQNREPDRQFGSAEVTVYRFLLEGRADARDCRAATGFDEDTVQQALDELARAELIQQCPGESTWLATSPNLAFADFLARLRAEYALLSERSRALYGILDEVQTVLLSGSAVDSTDMVAIEKVTSEQLCRTLTELLGGARQAIRVLHPTTVSDSVPWWDVVRDSMVWKRGIDVRSIYPHTTRRKREVLRFLRELKEAGAQFRTTASVLSPLVLVDDAAVLLRECGEGGVLAREPTVVAFFDALFEDTWERAVPVTEYDYDQDVWREIELLVLGELNTGRSAEAIARRLDISTRTLRRYVTGLYERFGVETRFQLGVAAAQARILPNEPGRTDEVSTSQAG